jgi:phage terminase Nu1 subunit (DNA packaging protein)
VNQATYARHRGVTRQSVSTAVRTGRIRLKRGLVDIAEADAAWAGSTHPTHGGERGRKGTRMSRGGVQTTARPAIRARNPNSNPVTPKVTSPPRRVAPPVSRTKVRVGKQAELPLSDSASNRARGTGKRSAADDSARLEGLNGASVEDTETGNAPSPDELASRSAAQSLNAARVDSETWKAKLSKLEYEKRRGELLDAAKTRKLIVDVARGVRDAMQSIPLRIAPVLAPEMSVADVDRILSEEISRALGGLASLENDMMEEASA